MSPHHQVPYTTFERSSKMSSKMVTVGDMSGAHATNPMLPSIITPGKPLEQEQEVQKAPHRKSDDSLMTKVPDQQAPSVGQFGASQGVIAPSHITQITDVSGNRDRPRSNQHSRRSSIAQNVNFSGTAADGNRHPREHRKRAGSELQLESSKRSPPSEEQKRHPSSSSLYPDGKQHSKPTMPQVFPGLDEVNRPSGMC